MDQATNDVESSKREIIRCLYLHTADENYIVARWCVQQGLGGQFIWNAMHAIEKYLKCALLMNGVSVRNIGHNVGWAYRRLTKVAGALLPETIARPEGVIVHTWRDETPAYFIARLSSHDGAGVRYAMAGHSHHQSDLFKLDAVVFAIRRLCLALDEVAHGRASDQTHREMLKARPDFAFAQMQAPLQSLQMSSRLTTDLSRAAFSLNMPFAPEDFDHGMLEDGFAMSGPVLERRMVRYLQSDDEQAVRVGIAVREWFLKNNAVGASLRREIEGYGPQGKPRRPVRNWIDRMAQMSVRSVVRRANRMRDVSDAIRHAPERRR